MILLIYPPAAKPCEPPAGIARLSGMLAACGAKHRILDANIEGLLHVLRTSPEGRTGDAWSRRAFRDLDRNLSLMRSPALYRQIDRYKRVVNDLGKVLSEVSPAGVAVGLSNYEDGKLSPVKSDDLLTAAERPEVNPFFPYFRARLEGLFTEKEPTAVGLSLNFLSQALCAFSMIGFIKRRLPGVRIILGGGLITSWVKNMGTRNPFSGMVDDLVSGPGEYQLLSLLGIGADNNGLPRPDYGSMPRDDYLSPGFALPYSASSGCYWNRCGFCPEKAEGNPYIPIPASQVKSDLAALTAGKKPLLLHFLDNAISPSLLNAICRDGLDLPWYGFARVEPRLADTDFCVALRRAGCVMLKLGIESGDQCVLDAMGKGINIETASTVLQNLREAGIAAFVYLIFGTPAENEASARRTLEFTVRHSDYIDFLNLAIFNMPLCGAGDPAIRGRKFYEGDLSLYADFPHPSGWDRRRVRLFLDREFKRHPAVARILKKEPPVFTSNHAPFFVMKGSEDK